MAVAFAGGSQGRRTPLAAGRELRDANGGERPPRRQRGQELGADHRIPSLDQPDRGVTLGENQRQRQGSAGGAFICEMLFERRRSGPAALDRLGRPQRPRVRQVSEIVRRPVAALVERPGALPN